MLSVAAVLAVSCIGVTARAADALITAVDGEVVVNATETATKILAMVAGIVAAAVIVWMIRPAIHYVKSLLFGRG